MSRQINKDTFDSINDKDDSMILDGASDNDNVNLSESEGSVIGENLTQLRSEMLSYMEAFSQARLEEDEGAVDDALKGLDRAKRSIKAVQGYRSFLNEMNSESEKQGRASLGLSLSHRDLPKFQLASSVVRPFPNQEVYESAEHFLSRFENVIVGSVYREVEHVWKQFLPLCLPYSDNAWVETELKLCSGWKEARAAFKTHFGSKQATSHFTHMVFTMTMSTKETLSDYSKKYLKAVYDAGLPKDDPRIADRFLSSLTPPIQTLIRISVARTGESREADWTVEYLAKVGRDVLGDERSLYSEACLSVMSNSAIVRDSGQSIPAMKRHDSSRSESRVRVKPEGRVWKKYICTQHGRNNTHNTNDCYTLKNRSGKERKNDCFRCGKPWQRGHVCEKRKVLAVAPQREDADDGDDESQAAQVAKEMMMEGLSYDGKKEKGRKKYEADNAFNLLTPIIVQHKKLIGMIDTGSDVSFINMEILKNININKINKLNGTYNFLSDNNDISRIGVTHPLHFKYANGITFTHKLEVMKFNKGFGFDLLLGTDILSKMNIGLTGVAYKIEGEFSHSDTVENDDLIFENINIDRTCKHVPDDSPAGTSIQRSEFFNTIKETLGKNLKISETSCCPMPESIIRLPTKDGATAYRRQYPIPHALRSVLDRQIDEWLTTGTVIKSKVNTSFNSPLLLVPKRNKAGEIVNHRVCLDVRLLNKLLPPSFNYPVPIIREIFDNLAGKKVFSTIDLSNAYHRFKVAAEDVHKLTFTHNNSQYSFIKGCFGIKMLTSQFQKCLAILFDGMDCVQNFVDDCIIASDSYEEHARDVKMVIDKLTSVNLIINQDKCVWFQHSVRLLGFVVNTTGTKVDPSKLTNVENWPLPNKSFKQIQQFMGLINYFREYIPMISRVAEPITRLSHATNVQELWTDEQTQSFVALKQILQSNVILHYPDMEKQFFVATDASLYGVAAVLYQRDQHGRDQYISFVSSSLSPSQRRWSTTKRELYAIVLALQKFRKFVWGRHFVIYTDHKALIYLHTQKIANPMMIGWIETLLDFDFEVVHIPGIMNKLPDILSRLYPPLDNEHKLVEDNGSHKSKITKKRF